MCVKPRSASHARCCSCAALLRFLSRTAFVSVPRVLFRVTYIVGVNERVRSARTVAVVSASEWAVGWVGWWWVASPDRTRVSGTQVHTHARQLCRRHSQAFFHRAVPPSSLRLFISRQLFCYYMSERAIQHPQWRGVSIAFLKVGSERTKAKRRMVIVAPLQSRPAVVCSCCHFPPARGPLRCNRPEGARWKMQDAW